MHVGTTMESRDATLFETEFSMKNTPSTSSHESILFPETHEPVTHADFETHVESPEEDDNEAPRRSKRQKTAKSFGDDFIDAEAYSSLDADYWKEAVRSEMDSIMSNGTWEVVDRPLGCKPVGCKWVFKKKLRPDGTIEKYKARLVAKGYTQR